MNGKGPLGLHTQAHKELMISQQTVQVLENENRRLKAALHNKQIMEQLLFSSLTGATGGVCQIYEKLIASKELEPDPQKRSEILGKVGLAAAEIAFSAASACYEMLSQDREEEERKAEAEKNSEEAKPSDSSAEPSTPN